MAEDRKLHLKRYETLDPVAEDTKYSKPEFNILTSTPTTIGTSSSFAKSFSVFDALPSDWNPYRTATMAAWSAGFYAPFYVFLYRLYDRYLPKQTPASIGARVALSFVCSIPVNAAFYTYGTTVQHTTDWWSLSREVQYELQDMGAKDCNTHLVPYEWDQLLAKIRCKLETELPTTITTSGSCWIPINLFTFTVVPSHLRPLSLMFFSIFWNCYLSLAQHRDLVVPDEALALSAPLQPAAN